MYYFTFVLYKLNFIWIVIYMNFYLYYKVFYFPILQLFIYTVWYVCGCVCVVCVCGVYEELICKNR